MSCDQSGVRRSGAHRIGIRQPHRRFHRVARPCLSSVVLLLVTSNAAGENSDDPREVLTHVRQTVVDTVKRLPRYVCIQSIERSRYAPETSSHIPNLKHRLHACDDILAEVNGKNWKRRLASSDRLRLEVAVNREVPGLASEMYSWPGEHAFHDHSVFELVRDGAMSTGSFSSLLTAIFGGEAARFSYNGEEARGGKRLSDFGFQVPREKSKYTYVMGKSPGQEFVMAYDGVAFVDLENSELARLIVRAGELPPETGACELTQTMEYGRVRIHDTAFLLPTEVRTRIVHTDESEAVNQIRYSACNEFQGGSVARYGTGDPQDEAAGNNGAARPPAPLPPGLAFKVVFTDPISAATAAAGDVIRGRLKTAIHDESFKVLVPEGTPVSGRLVRIRRFYGEPSVGTRRRSGQRDPSLVVDIRLEAIEVGGQSRPIKAAVDPGVRKYVQQTGLLTARVDIGSLDQAQDRSEDSDIAVFPFWDDNPKYVVKGNLESSWVTRAP